jgi:hypothetical protein
MSTQGLSAQRIMGRIEPVTAVTIVPTLFALNWVILSVILGALFRVASTRRFTYKESS